MFVQNIKIASSLTERMTFWLPAIALFVLLGLAAVLHSVIGRKVLRESELRRQTLLLPGEACSDEHQTFMISVNLKQFFATKHALVHCYRLANAWFCPLRFHYPPKWNTSRQRTDLFSRLWESGIREQWGQPGCCSSRLHWQSKSCWLRYW